MYDEDKILEEAKLDEWDNEFFPDQVKANKAVEADKPDFTFEYFCQFCDLLDACGSVSYYLNMKKCLDYKIRKATAIAAAYKHDRLYYLEQLNEWRFKARRSLSILKFKAEEAGIQFDISDFGVDKDWLNALALSKDRRKQYKGYLTRNHSLSPTELEIKYQKLLQKRIKKSAR